MSPGWKFQKNFKKESILYLVEKREMKNFDIKLVLNHLGILDKTKFCENLLQDDVLMAIDSAEELRTWATKNSKLSQELLLKILPLAGDNVWNQQNLLYAQKSLKYVGLLNENFKELWRKWANREDEVCALEEQLSTKDREIIRLSKDFKNAINQRDGHYAAAKKWKQMVFDLSERLKELTGAEQKVKDNISDQKPQYKPFNIVNQAPVSQTGMFQTNRSNSNYLETLKHRCENLEFSQHIRSLQPPEKFNNNPELFQTWASELIDYFENKQKDFCKSSDRSLVIFAQSRLEGESARIIQQLALSGKEFLTIFDLLKFLYQTFGIKDLYSHYERKYIDLKWPSGPNQTQNLAIFRAQISPCKEILGWNNRAAISKLLSKLPTWSQRDLASLRYDDDNYDEFLEELDNYFRRNYASRQLIAASKHGQHNPSDRNPGKNPGSENLKSSGLNQTLDTANTKKIKEFKTSLKEELRGQDQREGRCYHCHQKGHLTSLCPKKVGGNAKHVTESKTSDRKSEICKIDENCISSSSECSDTEN
ncbi:hypothetical protein HI914_04282 [Erysiphe necator]|nr:hypothetical protein HI914_04283 [Erysiphe necator]KAI6247452.1 hypothetical protein HI914_04282 [Erysiphe necator]